MVGAVEFGGSFIGMVLPSLSLVEAMIYIRVNHGMVSQDILPSRLRHPFFKPKRHIHLNLVMTQQSDVLQDDQDQMLCICDFFELKPRDLEYLYNSVFTLFTVLDNFWLP